MMTDDQVKQAEREASVLAQKILDVCTADDPKPSVRILLAQAMATAAILKVFEISTGAPMEKNYTYFGELVKAYLQDMQAEAIVAEKSGVVH